MSSTHRKDKKLFEPQVLSINSCLHPFRINVICSLVLFKKENSTLKYFPKLLPSYLAPNTLSRRHGGQPFPGWAVATVIPSGS